MKQIEGYPNYSITLCGKIYRGDKQLKAYVHRQGYLFHYLYKEGVRKKLYAHRIIANAFIPNPLNKPYVNHKNGIKDDNSISNLEWVTGSENCQHAYDTGLRVVTAAQRINYYKGKNNDKN